MRPPLALESTLLAHGVPRDAALPLADELCQIAQDEGAAPRIVAVVDGKPIAGLDRDQLEVLLSDPELPKANAANLGTVLFRGQSAATTVSATMEIASAAGIRVFATGGLGGVHPHLEQRVDISADLGALARIPMAVVCSGVKSILDVASTRELLESLAVPVVGFKTDEFPAFYLRQAPGVRIGVDCRFDDVTELAQYIQFEFKRSNRAVVVANPIPLEYELDADALTDAIEQAERHVDERSVAGGERTPAILSALHEHTHGATLHANLALVRSNTVLGAHIAKAMTGQR